MISPTATGTCGPGLYIERVDVSEPASISTGIAARYATALFGLAEDAKSIDALEADVATLAAALAESSDFADLITSPIYGRDESEAAVAAIGKGAGLSDITTNTLRLMAQKRRLFILPALVVVLRDKIADHKGQVTAEVASAKPLTKDQEKKLAKTLKDAVGKDVTLNATVDETLIGGLIVKVGSRMIDTSIRSKLNTLQNTMKEVG